MSFNYLKAASKIICIGRNYAAHAKELNNPVPKQPFFFLKPTSSIVTPALSPSQLPQGSSYNGLREDGSNPGPIYIPKGVVVHHEVELALVMDKTISNADQLQPAEVFSSIRGVALALDLTARNVQDEAKRKGLPWSIGKGFDTFLPISQLVPKEKLLEHKDNLQDIFHLRCSVNGSVKQEGTSELMLNPLHKIIQHISTMMTVESGDIILTGTPSGVGQIVPGDNISCELYCKDQKLVEMSFVCEERPGPYIYKET